MLVGTLVEVWEEINPFPLLSTTRIANNKGGNLGLSVLKSFSILNNGRQILNTETRKGHLDCLNGMRTISMCWIIYGHLYLIGQFYDMFGGGVENRMFINTVSIYPKNR